MVDNKDMPILTYSTEMDSVDPIVYFSRNMVKLAMMKRFEVQLDRSSINYLDYAAQIFFTSFDNYRIIEEENKNDDYIIKFDGDNYEKHHRMFRKF